MSARLSTVAPSILIWPIPPYSMTASRQLPAMRIWAAVPPTLTVERVESPPILICLRPAPTTTV
ncbi:MAG: hypothetical protein GXP25_19080 [Planctomycetes bacterium]|nr:hypothetical protein [Planctomycetota bacterium]